MELHEKDEVRYLTHKNLISDEICTVIELCDNGKTVRLKKPNGEMIKLYHDRIRSANSNNDKQIVEYDDKKFNPWHGLTNGEVWIKQSKFNDTIIMKSYTIIDLDNNTYKSINTYDDKFSNVGIKDYNIKNKDSLISKLEKKGYHKMSKGAK
jgi:hypothetical protein